VKCGIAFVRGVLRLRVGEFDGEDENVAGVSEGATLDFDAVTFAPGEHAGIGD